MNTTSLHETYQATPYPSRPVPLSHPDHLYVVGRLHGLTPTEVTGARVLELGCASGGNLLPMAASLPEAEFVGVDLSERQIEMAQAGAAAGGLENVEFLAGDALSLLAGGLGRRFDYIILHGLYSWVPVEVQAALLPLCRRLLTDPFTRQLLPLLDGQTDRGALMAAVAGFDVGDQALVANDDPQTLLDAALHQLAERCLLVQ